MTTASTSPDLGFERLLRITERFEAAPPAEAAGVWSAAHVLEHCAQSIEYSISGYPTLRSGLFRITIGRIAKRKFLRSGSMRHDTMAAVAGAPPLVESSLGGAALRLRSAVDAFRRFEGPFAEHLAYGPCTKQEYESLHVMHFLDHVHKLDPALAQAG